MLIRRDIQSEIMDRLQNYTKAIIIYGARQVGKTTLCKDVLGHVRLKTLAVNADEQRYIDVLSSRDSRRLLEFVENYDVLFIDEAQRVSDIGINLKILIDAKPDLRILVTGSSSFELASSVSEPLTGRAWTYELYPIACSELRSVWNTYEMKEQLYDRLRWGSYPELFSLKGEDAKQDYLRGLVSNYLYKDVLALGGMKNPDKIHNLLKLIAFQIGSEVSLTELGTQLSMSKETVARYIDILEKSFVLFTLSGFSRNLRKEVTKMNKYYFYDVGVRNAVIDNLHALEHRNDHGQLWENFLISERMKDNSYRKAQLTAHFWRVYTGAEIDYIEDGGGHLGGYEFKWNKGRVRQPDAWKKTYAHADWQLINQENWLDFVTGSKKR